MFYLELVYYYLFACVAIISWERIKGDVKLPIIRHYLLVSYQLIATLISSLIIIFFFKKVLAADKNQIAFIAISSITLFSFYFNSKFSRKVIKL